MHLSAETQARIANKPRAKRLEVPWLTIASNVLLQLFRHKHRQVPQREYFVEALTKGIQLPCHTATKDL